MGVKKKREDSSQLPLAVTYHDAKGRITHANKTAQKILGLSLDELTGHKFSDEIWNPVSEDGKKITIDHDPVEIAIQKQEIVSDVIFGIENPETENKHWLLVTAIPINQKEKSEPEQIICEIRDITRTGEKGDRVLSRLDLVSQNIELRQDIERLKDETLSAYDRMIEAWSAAIELQDQQEDGHTNRVVNLALELAKEIGFEDEDLMDIRRGALLHDLGKLSIPSEILLKPGNLTTDEFEVVKRHPEFARKWLSQIEFLQPALQIPYHHHEKWDGSGYPQGLSGEEIPLVARMFAIVDVWDVLNSDRPYRRAMTKDEALDLIVSESGKHFDPEIVERFLQVLSHGDYIDMDYEIKIKAFGQGRVWVQNKRITSKDWQVYAARDLFFLLLAHPYGLSKEQVGLYMWPDLSPDDLDIRFKNTLYRLRCAVGNQAILLSDTGYHFNIMLEYVYDVEIFETMIQKAKKEPDHDQKISYLSQAVQHYQGEYLSDNDHVWVMTDQERYRLMYIDALTQLAELHFEQQDLKGALSFCVQALAEDPVYEEAHRLAMQIHAANGNRVEVIRQYEACKSSCLDRFGVLPSDKTRELYEELNHS